MRMTEEDPNLRNQKKRSPHKKEETVDPENITAADVVNVCYFPPFVPVEKLKGKSYNCVVYDLGEEGYCASSVDFLGTDGVSYESEEKALIDLKERVITTCKDKIGGIFLKSASPDDQNRLLKNFEDDMIKQRLKFSKKDCQIVFD
jgi:hypothetical protein